MSSAVTMLSTRTVPSVLTVTIRERPDEGNGARKWMMVRRTLDGAKHAAIMSGHSKMPRGSRKTTPVGAIHPGSPPPTKIPTRGRDHGMQPRLQ